MKVLFACNNYEVKLDSEVKPNDDFAWKITSFRTFPWFLGLVLLLRNIFHLSCGVCRWTSNNMEWYPRKTWFW